MYDYISQYLKLYLILNVDNIENLKNLEDNEHFGRVQPIEIILFCLEYFSTPNMNIFTFSKWCWNWKKKFDYMWIQTTGTQAAT